AAAEGPQIAVGQVEADLRARLLARQAIPGQALDLIELDAERRCVGLARHEVERVGGDFVQAGVVHRHGQRALSAAADEIEEGVTKRASSRLAIEVDATRHYRGIARQIFSEVNGKSRCRPPSASLTALAMAAGAPTVPDSPTPLTPSGFKGEGVTVWAS